MANCLRSLSSRRAIHSSMQYAISTEYHIVRTVYKKCKPGKEGEALIQLWVVGLFCKEKRSARDTVHRTISKS